jgi:hypothetical protein
MTKSLRGSLRFEPWKIAIASFIAGVGVATSIVAVLSFFLSERKEMADERTARALCATSVGSPELIAPCTRAVVARIQLERQMRQ